MSHWFIAAVVITALAPLVLLAEREWQLRQKRQAHAALFDAARDGPRLRQEADLVLGALGPDVVAEPEVELVPPLSTDAERDARSAVALAGARLGIAVDEIQLVIGGHAIGPLLGGLALLPHRPYTVSLEGDQVTLTVDNDTPPPPPEIHLGRAAWEDPELLHVIAAHEVAHHALLRGGLGIDPTDLNEERTEIATLLAGYGPLMERWRYREYRSFGPGRDLRGGVKEWGRLSLGALAYLREYRAQLRATGSSTPAT